MPPSAHLCASAGHRGCKILTFEQGDALGPLDGQKVDHARLESTEVVANGSASNGLPLVQRDQEEDREREEACQSDVWGTLATAPGTNGDALILWNHRADTILERGKRKSRAGMLRGATSEPRVSTLNKRRAAYSRRDYHT